MYAKPEARSGCIVLDLDSKRFQELEILIVDFQLGVAGQGRNHGSLVRGFFARLADPDGSLQHEKDVVTAVLDPRYYLGDLLRIRQGFINRLTEFFHQVLKMLIHVAPLA